MDAQVGSVLVAGIVALSSLALGLINRRAQSKAREGAKQARAFLAAEAAQAREHLAEAAIAARESVIADDKATAELRETTSKLYRRIVELDRLREGLEAK